MLMYEKFLTFHNYLAISTVTQLLGNINKNLYMTYQPMMFDL